MEAFDSNPDVQRISWLARDFSGRFEVRKALDTLVSSPPSVVCDVVRVQHAHEEVPVLLGKLKWLLRALRPGGVMFVDHGMVEEAICVGALTLSR